MSTLFSKKCPCGAFDFTFQSKPHKDLTAICPECRNEVSLADAKALTDPKPAANAAPPEVK